MKKILIAGLSCLMLLMLFGCSKNSTEAEPKLEIAETILVEAVESEAKQTPKEINSAIIGSWQYYRDVPHMPAFKTWRLVFNSDGTYETFGDTEKNTKKSHGDTWGSGVFIISEDDTKLTMIKENAVKERIRQIEIREDNGITQLVFLKDDRSSPTPSTGYQDERYYTIFEKQE